MKDEDNHGLMDVVGLGNAIVDVLIHESDAFLNDHGIIKGGMTLVDENYAANLYRATNSTVEMSGGSVGNTIAGLAALGSKGSYIGKVRDDKLGNIFIQDLKAMGVKFETSPASSGPTTAHCLVIITPDSQRSMLTYLGASVKLCPEDIVEETIRRHKITFLEGYLWDSPCSKDASIKAAQIAHEAGQKVALTLSDSLCVDRHRESFHDFLDKYVDIFFANESEIIALYEAEDFESALSKMKNEDNLALITRSERGSIIVSGEKNYIIHPEPVHEVVDATGAGDLYAAGALYGLANGHDLETCGKIGSIAAAEIISHVGARPEANLRELTGNLSD
ncbi:MAG: adenosine kinase [Nitrososphaerales archaeon]|jgi:sugar/nucleoside kinase (ribokinase family)|nr:adenosine kinase [Nitrososphaerales archaeon]